MKWSFWLSFILLAVSVVNASEIEALTKEERISFIGGLEVKFEDDIKNDPSITVEQAKEMREWIVYFRERETWPHTVDEAVTSILLTLPEDDKKIIVNEKRNKLFQYNDSWGMGIRNAFGLWKGNPELSKSACGANCEPEEVSIIIMQAVWDSLQKTQYKLLVE